MKANKSVLCALILLLSGPFVRAQEIVLEEVRVEASFDMKLQPPNQSAVQNVVARLIWRAETQRALDLKIANRTPLSTLLDLTKYSPIPLGGSESHVDTFFLRNDMRPDLNPPKISSLFHAE
ncbi:MAG: hypothetical protein H0T95_08520 [Chthoniobacterales bacterium]|nr:hypothetical protein [Chthoniobacterales bacterium]MBA3762961.1 hypothetical protein [Chthoniobacterales bacterium]